MIEADFCPPIADRRLRPAALVVLSALLLSVVCRPADAQQPELLFCGTPITRQLEAGGTGSYTVAVADDRPSVIDVTDVSGTIGLLRLRNVSLLAQETCEGTLPVDFQADITVDDCLGTDSGTYTVALNVVADNLANCGTVLTCGTAAPGALTIGGEVDSYVFEAIEGQDVSVTATDAESIGQVRLRSFDPDGHELVDTCSGSNEFSPDRSGRYTVLLSACNGTATGSYSVKWQAPAACPVAGVPGYFAYVNHAGNGTIGVIDTATNKLTTVVPTHSTATGNDELAGLVISPNNGFLYAGFPDESGFISIINTSTNAPAGGISTPSPYLASLAVHPSGLFLYAPTGFSAIAVIDTVQKRIVGTIPAEADDDLPSIAVGIDGRLYAIERAQLGVFDTATRTRVTSIVDSRLQFNRLTVSPDGMTVYAYYASILVIDTQTYSVVDEIPIAANDVDFAADGMTAFASVGNPPGLAVIDTSSRSVTKTIPIADFREPYGVAVTPNGQVAYLVDYGSEQGRTPRGLAVIDVASGLVVARVSTGGDNPVDVVIGSPPSGLCAGDTTAQTKVTVGELVSSVNSALDGCPTDPQNPAAWGVTRSWGSSRSTH